MNFARTIQMCIFNGISNDKMMCELSNWNGRVYKFSRNDINEFAKREDASNTGIYFLFGKDEFGDTIYIGETEEILKRLKQHLNDENYWNDFVVIISKDNILNKAHVKYLENKFYNLAKEANRYKVINGQIPTCSSISEYDAAMLEEFISNALLLVNAIGYKAFDTVQNAVKSEKAAHEFYINAARGAKATGILLPDGFAVLRGSRIADPTTPTIGDGLKKIRKKLIDNGTINPDFVFEKDYVFSSPSYAAGVVMGRRANGKTEWKDKNKKNLHDIETEEANN